MFHTHTRKLLLAAAATAIVACSDSSIDAQRLGTECYEMPSRTTAWDVPTYMNSQGFPTNAQWQKVQIGPQLYACYRGLGK